MNIKTEIEARAAISAVAEWLQQLDEPARKEDANEGETLNAELAREWADQLLEVSTANGLCGCLLCQA